MRIISRTFAISLSMIVYLMIFSADCKATEIADIDNVISYSIPLISNETNASFINIYEINGEYYLDLKDIAIMTRCTYEEKNEVIFLKHGIRELEINVETCVMNDSDIKDQGKIKLKKIDNAYLCEAIPMLFYLGADCSIDEDTGCFQVLMPMITFWEAFMPDYLDYHFNTEEWLGSEKDIEVSLFCDILMDLLDVTNGHGLYATDQHYEDALYDILDVDLYSYESVQCIVEIETSKLDEFLQSDRFSDFFSQGLNIGQELFNGYVDYYMTGKIAIENVNETYQYLRGNYTAASEIGHQINLNICKQIGLQNMGKDALGISAMALDTAYNVYNLMCYDQESRTLFSNCITDDVEEFTGYDVEYLQKITNKISAGIKTDQSIVASAIIDEISEWACSEIMDRSIEFAASAFEGGNIYVFATKLGVLLAEIPLRNSFNAYSDHMDMLWLAATQTDIAQLATRYMLITLKDENASNIEHMEMVKKLMALYYRTTIAFCENAVVSCEEFGNMKTKVQKCAYFEQVENYMAAHLYLMTNCTVVPIFDYNSLSDDILSASIINALVVKTDNVAKENLKEYLASQVGADNIIDFCATDFDNDNTIEAFAIVGESYEAGGYLGSLYYIKNNILDLILEDEVFEIYVQDKNILDFGNEKFYITGEYYMTGDSTYIFGVSNGNWYEHSFSRCGIALTQIDDTKDLLIIHSAYDATEDGSGHTWKEYFLYWDDGFKEYGAIYISEEDLLKCEGAKDILNQITSKGGIVTNIMYRKNGIININLKIVDDTYLLNENATLRLNGNSVSLITVNDYGENTLQRSSYGGIYLTARYPDIASYPDSFPVK